MSAVERRGARFLGLVVLAAAWAGLAGAAPTGGGPPRADRGITLEWKGGAWVEVVADHPALRPRFPAEDREITLYWTGTGWAELLPGMELRYSRLTGASREVTRPEPGGAGTPGPGASSSGEGSPSAVERQSAYTPVAVAARGRWGWSGAGAGAAGADVGSAEEASHGVGAAGVAGRLVGTSDVVEAAPPPAPAASAAQSGTSASVALVGALQDGLTQSGQSFQLGTLRDLQILVDWASLPGAANVQRLEVVGPDGNVYQTFTAAIAGTHMETRLPVGGTWITQHGLTGAWRVQVYLNKDASPVATRDFHLRR